MQVNEQKQSELTPKMLRKRLSYSRVTGVFVWKDGQRKGLEAGHLTVFGYRMIRLFGHQYYAHRLAWLWVHKKWPEGDIDHKNGQRSDNRIANLREVSRSENLRNQRMCPRNTSGQMGVWWLKDRSKWEAEIKVDSQRIRLGKFKSYEEAVAARSAAEIAYGFDPTHGR